MQRVVVLYFEVQAVRFLGALLHELDLLRQQVHVANNHVSLAKLERLHHVVELALYVRPGPSIRRNHVGPVAHCIKPEVVLFLSDYFLVADP